jgi:hypothetical protein
LIEYGQEAIDYGLFSHGVMRLRIMSMSCMLGAACFGSLCGVWLQHVLFCTEGSALHCHVLSTHHVNQGQAARGWHGEALAMVLHALVLAACQRDADGVGAAG